METNNYQNQKNVANEQRLCAVHARTSPMMMMIANLVDDLSLLTDTVDLSNILRPSSVPLTDHNHTTQWLHPEPRLGTGEHAAVTKNGLRGAH